MGAGADPVVTITPVVELCAQRLPGLAQDHLFKTLLAQKQGASCLHFPTLIFAR
jgi:hypothetical protein